MTILTMPFGDGALRNWPISRMIDEIAASRVSLKAAVLASDWNRAQSLASKIIGLRIASGEIAVQLKDPPK
ncbi:hypothetical protein JQ628_11455 [Bradyrhizobium lablabi]|uniref:hypothetical protein n=1 Tax=Bradyrhizobium lablabi TaxID=722472 RepID=UPI001BA9D66F|nr:hypothetical protein [Bradyrhizobium lablabi]MBR1122132.1 hypothetical protein [Bradyrhizobium lablabi]